MLSPFLYWILLFAVAAYAFGRGRRDERVAAIICIAATIATWLVNSPYPQRFAAVEGGVLIVDVLALTGFTALALHSGRFWPLWVAGFQLTTTMAHGLRAIDVDLIPKVYAAAARFWVYPIFLAIIIGTWRSSRRNAAQDRESAAV